MGKLLNELQALLPRLGLYKEKIGLSSLRNRASGLSWQAFLGEQAS